MFQSVRPNSQIYIFHKGDTPRIEVGFVTAQPVIRPKYQVPPAFGQPQEMVVDISAKVNGQTINYNGLPANLDIADSLSNGESIVISDNKEAMNAEILSLKQKSLDIINSVEFHKNLANNCDKILSELNPEFAEKQAQREELDSLKLQMSEMSKHIGDLMEANRRLIEQLSKNEN
mgnify:FL=1